MSETTVTELAALNPRDYTAEMKARLGDDRAWAIMLEPLLMERTRGHLTRMIDSIDSQKKRVAETGSSETGWLHGINLLRRLASARLDTMPPPMDGAGGAKQAKAWRAFSAELAEELESVAPAALTRIKTPYGGLTALQWLSARREKSE